ncbi:DNA mismatch repair protein [Chitinophaga sp. SYP-B3965]|uniref:MutS-related protein n=1 Tax=Chitinophaga sp. SYP-B3965 TaxID=2663120 RepID=UPI0012995822|nr:DNA mismatch repair protein [Chitinophaga sp. SYP-B3965]MRG45745.1 DNA mismatch repair protein [Chitinophaga sp. SYP-B3965]
MSFIADKQTLDDLSLLGKFKPHSIYSLFNKVHTAGGERLLDEMFHQPMTDPLAINQRSSTFRYFQDQEPTFPFRHEQFRFVENYLGTGAAGNVISATTGMLRKKIMGSLLNDDQYNILQTGLTATIEALYTLKGLLNTLNTPLVNVAKNILADKRLSWLDEAFKAPQLSVLQAAKYDHLLRHAMRDEMETLLDTIYQLDVYIAVSTIAREKDFSYAHALPAEENIFSTTALRHPGLDKAVANPLSLHSKENVIFLTGANMAGKSTLMKAFGISVYLAHMGFPVAAIDMRFSVRDGLYSSINVPDNLNMGYSHFYAEVLRVKKVAEEVSSGKNMIVIFDELFKGTNVKDAYDATLSVTAAFSKYRNCFFIISTHIIEVGDVLKQTYDNIQFSYLPTIMEGNVPRYPYTLTEGITSDRQGMIIIENEKIIDLLER